MKNERDKEELSRYFGHHQPSQKTPRTSRSQQQWFDDGMDDDDEDMKVAPDSFSKSNFNRTSSGKNSFNQDSQFGDFEEPPKKRKRASKLSRFAESFVLICVFVGIAIFLAYFALVSASDLLGLGQADRQIEVTLTEEEALAEAGRCLNCGCGEGCQLCKTICTDFAPFIEGVDRMCIDKEECVACGMCFNRCPNHNIEMVNTHQKV